MNVVVVRCPWASTSPPSAYSCLFPSLPAFSRQRHDDELFGSGCCAVEGSAPLLLLWLRQTDNKAESASAFIISEEVIGRHERGQGKDRPRDGRSGAHQEGTRCKVYPRGGIQNNPTQTLPKSEDQVVSTNNRAGANARESSIQTATKHTFDSIIFMVD